MGKKKALIIGINEYEDPGFERLKYAENDARAIYGLLINPDIGDFKREDVTLLTGRPKAEVEENLEEILNQAKRDDLVFIYFAGHGKLDKSGSLCLATQNTKTEKLLTTSVHLEHIRRMIDESDCKCVVFIIDSCFSGAAGLSLRSGEVPTESFEQISGQGKVIISASQAYERARELDDIGHGIFTYSLVKGLEDGEADRDEDGYISIDELYKYVYDKVKAETKGKQVPMKWGKDEKGELVIAKSVKTLEARRAEIERLSNTAKELQTQARLDEALSTWNRVLELDPKNAEAPEGIKQIDGEKKKRAALEAKIDKLFDYYQKRMIPTIIYNKAVGILRNPGSGGGDKEDMLTRLVEDLVSNHLTVENFVLSWSRIEKVEIKTETESLAQEEMRKAQVEEIRQEEERKKEEVQEQADRGEAQQEAYDKAAKEEAERKTRKEELKKKIDQKGIKAISPLVYGGVGGLIVLVLIVVALWMRPAPEPQVQEKEAPRLSVGEAYKKGEEHYKSGDYNSALPLFQRAAQAGDMNAMNYLGYMYQNGLGVEKNYGEAISWYKKGAEAGDSLAMANLGYMYANGLGIGQNYIEAVRWYQKGAEGGNALAMNNLGYMYASGLGVGTNYTEAVRWYKKGADAGDALAMNNLGHMYHHGKGLDRDYDEAVRWYRKGADGGNGLAMANLGLMYEEGLGLERDHAEARHWYTKAASLGNESGESGLKRLEESAEGKSEIVTAVQSKGRGGEVLYQDNFTTLDPAWGEANANLGVANGKLVVKPEINSSYVLMNQAKIFEDIDASVKITAVTSDNPTYSAGLIFWAKDTSDYYYFLVTSDGWYSVKHWVNQRSLSPVSWRKSAAINKGLGQTNEVRVVTKGSLATAYVNNTELISFEGQPDRGGSFIGMIAFSPEKATNKNVWEFSDLKVTK